MDGKRLDVVEVLKREKEYYLEQIKRINIALDALTTESTNNKIGQTGGAPKRSRRVKWMHEVEGLFGSYDELSIDDIQKKLIEKGIPEANTPGGRNSINTTLVRLDRDKGKIMKTVSGTWATAANVSDNEFKGI